MCMIFSFDKADRRRRLLAEPFPEDWLGFLHENMFLYRTLSEGEQSRLRDALRILLAEKYWEGCGGLTLTDEIRVTIAAWAALLVLGFEGYYFDELQTILVYPGGFLVSSDHFDDESERVGVHLGEAHHRGPVVLSWWEARWDGRRPGTRNVVVHEFAHKLAELGDPQAGLPPIDDPELEPRWREVVAKEYRRLREDADYERRTLLDHYGASSEPEFFAVATECFFLQPIPLRHRHPELYAVLAAWSRQDPAARRRPAPEDAAQARRAEQEYAAHVISECSAAIGRRPRFGDAYRARADYYVEQGEYDKAIADYSKVLRLSDNEDAEAFCLRGVAYREQDRYHEALDDFERAIALCPDYARAYCERGLARIAQGEEDAGLADLDRALHIDPNDDTTYQERGQVHHERGEYKQAIRDFTEAIGLYPYDAAVYCDRARTYLARADADRALADCAEALELEPDLAEPFRLRGLAYQQKRDFDRALADLTEGIRRDPEDAEAYRDRARLYQVLGRGSEARQDQSRADELTPEEPEQQEG
jgi:Mlc titration factor MtfA (ptsG expression regulator)/Tfp pilus assembly protein PilF